MSGFVEMAIGPEDGMVVQRFKEPMVEVRYNPENALDIAEAITAAAFEADTGLKPVSDTLKASLVEKHRVTLIQRLSVMLGSLRENKQYTNGKLAQELVETCLKEVF